MKAFVTAITFTILLGAMPDPAAALAAEAASSAAERIMEQSGVEGGLVVHLHCGDGRLTATLRATDAYLVQGLDTQEKNVDRARKHFRAVGIHGPVSAARFDGRTLPYADELVNLVVAERLGDVPMEEVLRVLAPEGVACIQKGDSWTTTVKPRPRELDQWSHYLHDATNNAVAGDTRVGPPRRMKWVCEPLWSRSHEFISSVAAMVTSGGRVFFVVDEGLTSLTDPPLPERWTLVAREAQNGVLLWKQPLPDWRSRHWRSTALRGRPASVPRRIVADADRLYFTDSYAGPVAVIDAATGRTLREIEGTLNAQELVLLGRKLLVQIAAGETPQGKTGRAILAADADTGKTLWRLPVRHYMPQSLAADGERLVFSDGLQTVCADIENGAELWRVPEEPNKKQRARRKTIILYGDTVVECDGGRIVARNAADGAQRWTARGGQGAMRAEDTFIARGCVWHAVGEGIAGYDLETGQLVRRIDPTVVDSPGHHLRCYRAKATENYLITQFRGAEFISLGDEAHCQNDWVRGPCRYGIMPAEGLLYVAPNPCFCYPGAKLTGLLALAPADEKMSSQTSGDAASGAPGRLEKGPAYDDVASQAPSAETGESATAACAWPTYRHDGRRSGASGGDVPPDAIVRWNVKLGGRLTPPVAAEGRVYVADKDAHVLYALNDSTGEVLWEFAAAAPIDSPPTLDGRRVLFGCADGWVYCLRADDGALAWRFQAAPEERLIVAFNRVESAWRVHGSVLVEDGLLYCTAGRSSFLDGGIHLYALEPATGRVMHHKRIDTWSPTRADAEGKPFIPSYHMEGAHSDILVSEGGKIFLAQMVFDKELREQAAPYNMRDPENPVKAMDITGTGFTADDPDLRQGFAHFRGFHRYMEKAHPELSARYRKEHGGMNMGDRFTGRHLSATAGFLDSAWFNRTYWQYSENWPGWYHGHRGAKTGNLLVVGPERTYAVQAFPTRNRQSPLFEPGKKGYLLLADDNDTEPVLDDQTRGATKGMGYTRLEPPGWYEWVPIRIRGMVLAGDRLFVTGPPDVVDPDDPMGSFEGRMGGALRSVRKSDGTTLAEIRLEAPPVFDGLIAASGRLFVATTEGRLVCLGAETE